MVSFFAQRFAITVMAMRLMRHAVENQSDHFSSSHLIAKPTLHQDYILREKSSNPASLRSNYSDWLGIAVQLRRNTHPLDESFPESFPCKAKCKML